MLRVRCSIIIFSIFLLVIFTTPVQAQKKNDAFKFVKQYINNIDKHNWYAIPNLWVKDSELLGFIQSKNNQKYKYGLFGRQQAKLKLWKELPYSYASQYIPSVYIEKYKNPRVFYVGVDYKVYKENKYQLDGVNYFFITTVLENGTWKIVTETLPPINSLIEDGYGFGTDDEKTFDARRMKLIISS